MLFAAVFTANAVMLLAPELFIKTKAPLFGEVAFFGAFITKNYMAYNYVMFFGITMCNRVPVLD
jgi:hypothetical protein